jgi:hypothetical protein
MLSVLSPKKFGIRRIPRLGNEGLKNEIGHVTHQSIGNFIWMKKIYTFGGQKGKKGPQSPKTEFGAQHQKDRVIYTGKK